MNIIIINLISLISGIVSGLGMGGGTILILLLVNFMKVEQHVAQATNLAFFIPTAIAACIVNAKQKVIDYKIAMKIIIFGIIGAIIGSIISVNINSKNLKKYFGIFLLIIETYEIIAIILKYRRKTKTNNNKVNK